VPRRAQRFVTPPLATVSNAKRSDEDGRAAMTSTLVAMSSERDASGSVTWKAQAAKPA
jgi:hypothetical protein